MTTSTPTRIPPATPEHQAALRISFRQPVSAAGFIDAAWWPRTLDLCSEVPPLVEELSTAGRSINRVAYNLALWDPAPRRLQVGDVSVRLGGFTTIDPLTVASTDAWGRERIDVLVIAPDTDPQIAQYALELAAVAEDPLRAGELFARATAQAAELTGDNR